VSGRVGSRAREEQVVRFTPEVVESDRGDAWEAFEDRQDENARRALFWHYGPLVESVASEVQMKWALALEQGRLAAPGCAGLSSALDTLGRDQGDTFEMYAVQHIKAMTIETLRANLNELEAMDFTPNNELGPLAGCGQKSLASAGEGLPCSHLAHDGTTHVGTGRHQTTRNDTCNWDPCVARATLGSGGREAVGVRVSPLAPLWTPEIPRLPASPLSRK
jgi:hypothetical protein